MSKLFHEWEIDLDSWIDPILLLIFIFTLTLIFYKFSTNSLINAASFENFVSQCAQHLGLLRHKLWGGGLEQSFFSSDWLWIGRLTGLHTVLNTVVKG